MRTCNKCNTHKSDSDFYTSNKSKCKDCIKAAAKNRYHSKRSDPDWIDSERKRQRDKYFRLGYKDKHKQSKEARRVTMSLYKNKYPEKYTAKILSQRVPVPEGMERHHWSYNKEDARDIVPIHPSDHALLHRFLVYDPNTKMYRTISGELLDTRHKHEEYMQSILTTESERLHKAA